MKNNKKFRTIDEVRKEFTPNAWRKLVEKRRAEESGAKSKIWGKAIPVKERVAI